MTWDGSKGGEFWRMEGGKKYETKSWSFEREKEDLKILAVENHRFCFDIT